MDTDDLNLVYVDAEAAYEKAVQSVERARHAALSNISFRKFSALDRFPDLQGLLKIKRLRASGTQVSSLGALSDLINLESLAINSTAITDLGPIAALKNLKTLIISNTQIRDLSAL